MNNNIHNVKYLRMKTYIRLLSRNTSVFAAPHNTRCNTGDNKYHAN